MLWNNFCRAHCVSPCASVCVWGTYTVNYQLYDGAQQQFGQETSKGEALDSVVATKQRSRQRRDVTDINTPLWYSSVQHLGKGVTPGWWDDWYFHACRCRFNVRLIWILCCSNINIVIKWPVRHLCVVQSMSELQRQRQNNLIKTGPFKQEGGGNSYFVLHPCWDAGLLIWKADINLFIPFPGQFLPLRNVGVTTTVSSHSGKTIKEHNAQKQKMLCSIDCQQKYPIWKNQTDSFNLSECGRTIRDRAKSTKCFHACI